MKIEFHPEVQDELTHSFEWYESKSAGLGRKFIIEVEKSVNRIQSNPELYPNVSTKIKRCLVSKFPFAILYSIYQGSIFVVAIMHLKRKPHYWKQRIEK